MRPCSKPFRAIADEVVIAADARADRERLEQYAAVADRVLRVEFSYFERQLAWLHVECLRPFDELLEGHGVVLGSEQPGRAGSAVLASVPGHPFFVDAARQAARTVGLGANSADATGRTC